MATLTLMVTTILSVFITHTLEKRIPLVALYIAFLTLVFGYLSLHRHNVTFIQVRDTVYDASLAVTIIIGFIFEKNVLQIALSRTIALSDKVWNKLAVAWTFFFILAALLNEYVRRTHPVFVWLDYKIVMMVVTIVFGVSALYVFSKNHVKE